MSCKHGNWHPCEECEAEDALWRQGFDAGQNKLKAQLAEKGTCAEAFIEQEAAAHTETIADLEKAYALLFKENAKITTQRDELLEASELCRSHMYEYASNTKDCAFDKLVAAIAKATAQ